MVSLISGLGGTAGFGENVLDRNDDSSTLELDVTSIFEDGLNFFGNVFTSLWVNNNGSVTFNGSRSSFTPSVITANNGNPEITPFFADVDTRGGEAATSPGGNSTGSNLVYYDFDTVNDRFVVTWDDVGYFSSNTDLTNAFQLVLTDRNNGNFDIEFRYENVEWTTGDASGGTDGLGGTPARAGYTASTGNPESQLELPASGNEAALLALDDVAGNTGQIGRWFFNVRSGDIAAADIPALPDQGASGWTVGDPHLSTLDGVGYDFQAVGEYVLLRGPADSFEVQARFLPEGENVSITSAIATRLGDVNLMIDATDNSPVSVNGAVTEIANFSSLVVGDDRIYREDDTYTIVYAGADGLINDGDSRVIVHVREDRVDTDIRLNTELLGSLEGLLGDGDGNPENDIALADGTILGQPLNVEELYGQFRDDWRVSDEASSLFTYDTGESLAGFYDPAHPGQIITLADLDPAVRATAEQTALNAGLSVGTANFDNAVLDFALTGDASFISSSLDVSTLSEANFAETFSVVNATASDDRVVIETADRILFDGLDGDDTAVINGSMADFDRSASADRNLLVSVDTLEEINLSSFETIEFDDGTVLLDIQDALPIEFDDGRILDNYAYPLYSAALNRTPDAAGLEFWSNFANSDAIQNIAFDPNLGQSSEVNGQVRLAAEFVSSPEFNTPDTATNDGFVTKLYSNFLGTSTPDQAGFEFWSGVYEDRLNDEIDSGRLPDGVTIFDGANDQFIDVTTEQWAKAWMLRDFASHVDIFDRIEDDVTGGLFVADVDMI